MSAADDRLLDQARVCSVPVYMTDKFEILDYYQEEYGDEWKSEIVSALGDVTDLKRSSLMRRFQGGRESVAPSRKQAEEYRQLGEGLPPLGYEAPANGYRVRFVGLIRISKDCYPRQFDIYVAGEDAADLAAALGEEDTETMWEMLFFIYFDGEDLAEDYCDDPSISIEAM